MADIPQTRNSYDSFVDRPIDNYPARRAPRRWGGQTNQRQFGG